jgi:serine/threonine protein kinase
MLVMEFMQHGSLYDVLQNPTIVLESDLILHIIKDIAHGVRFLHSSDPALIRGDLKSGNILIDSKFRAKLADFGLAKRNNQRVATGTPLWMAPELLSKKSPNTPKSDMYSIGVILNEIVSRKEPFHETTDDLSVIINGVKDPKMNRRPEIPSFCPVKVKKLIMFLWHADPTLRPTANELNNRFDDLNDQAFAACAPTAICHRTPVVPTGHSHDFLYQAFPRHVADVLRSGGKVEPERHDC